MIVQTMLGEALLNPAYINPDSFIIMKELDNLDLKVNHLSLYLKTSICEYDSNVIIEKISSAIDRINLSIFINGICEDNVSIRTLLAKNVVFEMSKEGIQIPFSIIYSFLNISKNNTNQTR